LEKEWEDDQLTAAGAPLDFTLERETAPAQLHHHGAEALYRGQWPAQPDPYEQNGIKHFGNRET